MASASYLESLTGGLDANIRLALKKIFDYLTKEWRFGRPDDAVACENMAGQYYEGTTSSVANREIAIAHKFGRAPYLAWPVLNLQAVNSKIPPLKVTRAADAAYVYVSSSETGIPITLYVEG